MAAESVLTTKEAKVHALAVQVVMTCECGHSEPLVIGGVDRKATCKACGASYVIQRIDYSMDVATGEATLHQAIAKLGEAPKVQLHARVPKRPWGN
jgi:hypothetical protein